MPNHLRYKQICVSCLFPESVDRRHGCSQKSGLLTRAAIFVTLGQFFSVRLQVRLSFLVVRLLFYHLKAICMRIFLGLVFVRQNLIEAIRRVCYIPSCEVIRTELDYILLLGGPFLRLLDQIIRLWFLFLKFTFRLLAAELLLLRALLLVLRPRLLLCGLVSNLTGALLLWRFDLDHGVL